MRQSRFALGIAFITFFFCNACKQLDVESPKNQLTTDKVFSDTTSAKSALLNIYVVLERTHYTVYNRYLSNYTDETLSTNNPDWNTSRLSSFTGPQVNNWTALYSMLYQCNMVIEQLGSVENPLPTSFKISLDAEARFLRAYVFFTLVNLYGNVPLITGTNVDANRLSVQVDANTIYEQIIRDLEIARNQLSIAYKGTGKLRANKACATAFLAKVYLYLHNWEQAEALSTALISSGNYTPLEAPGNAFKANSKESILQIGSQAGFMAEASSVIPSTSTAIPAFYFTDSFLESFENTDLRKLSWIGTNQVMVNGISRSYSFANKYKNRAANTTNPENLILFRIAEQYLIRAEARGEQGKLEGPGGAIEDINVLRSRAGLQPIFPSGKISTLIAIANERRHELFFEGAHRFMDLKRTGTLQQVMSAAKATWITSSEVLPIPNNEILNNPNMIQNEDY